MPQGFSQRCPNIFGRRLTQSAQQPSAAESVHDALQSMATISALLAAGIETAADPALTRLRLHQIETEVQVLRELVHAASGNGHPQVVDVAAEARDLVSSLSVGFPGVISVVTMAGAPALVTGTALHRVLANLLRNAMRAAGSEGRVVVTVDRGAHDVSLVVDDDGPGLGSLPVVHGLGLRSVRRLVHEAGGTVNAHARGRLGGASIQVRLPALSNEMAS